MKWIRGELRTHLPLTSTSDLPLPSIRMTRLITDNQLYDHLIRIWDSSPNKYLKVKLSVVVITKEKKKKKEAAQEVSFKKELVKGNL